MKKIIIKIYFEKKKKVTKKKLKKIFNTKKSDVSEDYVEYQTEKEKLKNLIDIALQEEFDNSSNIFLNFDETPFTYSDYINLK